MWQLCMDEIGWNRFIRSKQGDFHVWWKTDGKKNCQKNLEPKVFLALCKKAFIEAALASRQSKTTFLLLCWRVSCRLFFFIFFLFFYFYIWPRDLLQPGWSASSLLKNNFFLIHTYPLFFFFLFFKKTSMQKLLFLLSKLGPLPGEGAVYHLNIFIFQSKASLSFSQTLKSTYGSWH